jgi:hypothetical protein
MSALGQQPTRGQTKENVRSVPEAVIGLSGAGPFQQHAERLGWPVDD